MRKMIASLCLVFVAGCASGPYSAYSGVTPGCQSSDVTVDGNSINTKFCIKEAMFKPSQYLVTVNEQPVFSGNDYTRVNFGKQIKEGAVHGGCDAFIRIDDMASGKAVEVSELPRALVDGCNIQTDASGRSSAFRKDAACDEIFYKSLAPIIGKVYPVEVARQCSVSLGDRKVFEKSFVFHK